MANGLKTGADQFGMDTRIALAGMDFYFDQDFDGVIAANNIGVFRAGCCEVRFYDRYTGFKAGNKGVSEFFKSPCRTSTMLPDWLPRSTSMHSSSTTTAAVPTRTLTAVKA